MKKIKLIYILGTAYSGSTILGFILGSSPKIFNAGEIAYFNKLQHDDEICSCEKYSKDCPFWRSVYKNYKKVYDKPKNKIKTIIKIIMNKTFPKKTISNSNDYHMIKNILNKATQYEKKTNYLLDNSKGLWRLIYLIKHKNIAIKVIYLKRNIFGNISSFIKHKNGFFKSIFKYKTINYLIKKFLKKNPIQYIKIDYEKLCDKNDNEIKKLEDFLNTKITPYKNKLNLKQLHVPTGNTGTRELEKFNGLKIDTSWQKRLTRFQKFILNLIK